MGSASPGRGGSCHSVRGYWNLVFWRDIGYVMYPISQFQCSQVPPGIPGHGYEIQGQAHGYHN
jgi:hypothetical protein